MILGEGVVSGAAEECESTMNQIDLPGEKEKLWHAARADLVALIPSFRERETLLCPTCCRPVTFDEMSIEHILPQQALKEDPADVRKAVPKNQRSGLTLLCARPLVFKGNRLTGAGCNSWKGKHFDGLLRHLLSANFGTGRVTTGHQVALFSAGHLALFKEFGYQISLSSAGVLMRKQFFQPRDFIREMPTRYQFILGGQGPDTYSERDRAFWSEPFRISIEAGSATVAIRHMAFMLPLSRDPTKPFARALPYVPSKYKFRPDLSTTFD